jgi:hypothetical protein
VETALSAVSDQEWTGRDVTVGQIEHELAQLRSDSMDMRTSVMTHVAWAPPEWQERSRETLAGMAERHPSRTLLLFPQEDDRDALDAELSLECYTMPELERHVCSEVIELRLCGQVAQAPASVILPLVLPDLPVFLRWRGQPPFGDAVFEQLVDVVDRLVVDSREWPGAPSCYAKLVEIFDRVAVSDIVWARTLRWRRAIAELPSAPGGRQLRVRGPLQEASLLGGWLRSRLEKPIELDHAPADRIELIELDGQEVRAREERPSPSDLLSGELDRFSRDPVYEAAVAASQ